MNELGNALLNKVFSSVINQYKLPSTTLLLYSCFIVSASKNYQYMEKIEIPRIIYDDLRSLFLEANSYMAKRKFGQRKKNINNTDNPFGHFIQHQTAGGFLRPFTKKVESTLSLIGKEAPVFINMFDSLEFDDDSYPHTDANELSLRVENLSKILERIQKDQQYEVSSDKQAFYDEHARCLRYEDSEVWLNLSRNKRQSKLLAFIWVHKDRKVSFKELEQVHPDFAKSRGVLFALVGLDRAITTKSHGEIADFIQFNEKDKVAGINPKYLQ